MADEPLVDTHVHFWDHGVEGLRWAWLEAGYKFRKWESAGTLDAPRYTTAEFRAEAEGCGIGGVVHVHAADPIEDPATETAWLESVADETGVPDAIVGRFSLNEPGAPDLIQRHARYPRFRGVRDAFSVQHLVVDESAAAAMDALRGSGYSVELRRRHDEFAVLDEIAQRWPTVTLALSHACLPLERTKEDLDAWTAALRKLARHPNVVCKISAVAGASDPDWTTASIRPWVLTCVEVFGADRCVLGSNWPVDRLFGTYRALIDAYRDIVSELEPAERAAVLHGTAERVYALSDRVRPGS